MRRGRKGWMEIGMSGWLIRSDWLNRDLVTVNTLLQSKMPRLLLHKVRQAATQPHQPKTIITSHKRFLLPSRTLKSHRSTIIPPKNLQVILHKQHDLTRTLFHFLAMFPKPYCISAYASSRSCRAAAQRENSNSLITGSRLFQSLETRER